MGQRPRAQARAKSYYLQGALCTHCAIFAGEEMHNGHGKNIRWLEYMVWWRQKGPLFVSEEPSGTKRNCITRTLKDATVKNELLPHSSLFTY